MALEQGQPRLSYADVLALYPEVERGEIVDGVWIVTPAPTTYHQQVTARFIHAIMSHLDRFPELGVVFGSPIDVVLDANAPAKVFQPDVVFVAADRKAIIQNALMGTPSLVIEVVLPSNVRHDAVYKRTRYADYDVPEYWLVWPDDKQIDVFTGPGLANQVSYGPGETLKTPQIPNFELNVEKVFEKPW